MQDVTFSGARLSNLPDYRNIRSSVLSSSDDSSSSDEDSALWKRKRTKYCRRQQNGMDIASDRNRFAPLDAASNVPENGNQNGNVASAKRKKSNNIWGAVLQEQSLSRRLVTCDVDKTAEDFVERDVESYDYSKTKGEVVEYAHENDDYRFQSNDPFEAVIDQHASLESGNHREPVHARIGHGAKSCDKVVDEDMEADNQRGCKRRKPMNERLQYRSYDKTKSRDHIMATEEDSVAKVVNALAEALNEPKIDLLRDIDDYVQGQIQGSRLSLLFTYLGRHNFDARIVKILGTRKALELLYITEDTEDAGGMMVVRGTRRRTPGGVYIQLMKTDADVTKEQIKQIFEEERREFMKKRNQFQKKRKDRKLKDRLKNVEEMDKNMEEPSASEEQETSAATVESGDINQRETTLDSKEVDMDDLEEGEIP